MGHREPIKSGAEHDVVTGWRRVMAWCHRAGAKASVKRQMRRRARRDAKLRAMGEARQEAT